ncbi:hypothetical protein [Lentilactobacillus hilgardii]|jgi:hypothetical protein|uniref:DUF4833 domain-containing protein n=1 Tax=Lentilactobacillus hilgardii TaxID=1588 RepID=A0A6P1E479_LENHI|nr:hypothetical protein [Lentilactobacillus hilgardii]EEI71782.1 hypothetical protein HMPREF0496_0972 [Lentilactobacillus hilgardii ATCC 27305]MCT3393091.1 hypothetical protein [Lentilactobacillus hilgardii]QHB51359.1 hypothetical protein GQR93_03575 [Lentilactobacillus hilgardii]RRG10339.1 MAG: hypothetical protein DUD35_08005 [Lactobacillus sp.]
MRVWKKGLLVVLSTILFMTLSFNTKAAPTSTVPKAMRGNWYFYDYNSMNHYLFTKHRIRFDINDKGFRPRIRTIYRKMKLPGHSARTFRGYSFDIDYIYFPYKLKVAGRYRHVLISTMEQGPMAIYTHFMPAKTYTINARMY